jgi:hypothetical protein
MLVEFFVFTSWVISHRHIAQSLFLSIESREPGTPAPALLKGGEEKSPYSPYRITLVQNVLDGSPTLALFLPDSPLSHF